MNDLIDNNQYNVSEISNALKSLVERNFNNIKVKGEVSGMKYAPSGHVYFSIKDDNAILNCICWKGSISKTKFKLEDGLELICHGSITTYSGQSKYQLIVTNFEHAGIGALMALLAKRKDMFEKEGLFSAILKKKIPYFPRIIGVITSPTGAVIKDILHRISDRMPTRVILWPSLVQGENAANQISRAIEGFNNFHILDKPDIIIIARGGGSFEDLWSFNEEIVVRAVNKSDIAIISAIGHETDTTLIDYVSDLRAPTPTAAAEFAVPVRIDIILKLKDIERRILIDYEKNLLLKSQILSNLTKSFPKVLDNIFNYEQKIDNLVNRLDICILRIIENKHIELKIVKNIQHPKNIINDRYRYLDVSIKNIENSFKTKFVKHIYVLNMLNHNIKQSKLIDRVVSFEDKICNIIERLKNINKHYIDLKEEKIKNINLLLESYDHRNILSRGFSIIKNSNGEIISSVSEFEQTKSFDIEFSDGIRFINSFK